MKEERMKKANSRPLTRQQKSEIKALAQLRDDEINTRDLPEVRNWSGAKRGLFFRPIKEQLTLRIDADVVAWFKSNIRDGKGYQTSINRALREYVDGHERKPTTKRRRDSARA